MARVGRREFLAFGSVAMLTPLASNLAWAEGLPASQTAMRPMPVGYIEGSETIRNLKRLSPRIRRPGVAAAERSGDEAPLSVVPAASLFAGDTSLIGRALRMRVDGLYPPLALDRRLRRELPIAVDLEVAFPAPEPAVSPDPVLFYAWALRRQRGWNPSPPVSFRFPLDWEVLPELVMTVWPAQGAPVVLRTRFTLDDETGRPRLQRGVYLLGFTPGAWSWDVPLKEFARAAPAELFSVLLTIDSEPEE